MTIEDIHTTLLQQNMISMRDATPPPIRPSPGQSIKFPKGRKNGIARRHLQRTQTQDDESIKQPFVSPTIYEITWDRVKVDQYLETWESKGYLKLKPEKLKWSPFLLNRMGVEGPQTTADVLSTTVMPVQETNAESSSNDPFTPNGDSWKKMSPMFVDDETSSDVHVNPTTNSGGEDKIPTSRTSRSPSKASRQEEDTSLGREQVVGISVKKTSLRSQMTPSRAKTTSNEPISEPSDRVNFTRSRSARRTEKVDHAVASDAILTPEMRQRPSRSSRAASEAESSLLKESVPSTPNVRIPSPRKRLRVDSSPPEDNPLRVSPTGSMNGKPRGIVRSMPLRKSKATRLANGSDTAQDTTLPNPVCSSHVRSLESSATKEPSEQDDEVVQDREDSLEVKSEDLGTPLTSLTSRRSFTNDDGASPVDINGDSTLLSGPGEAAEKTLLDQSVKAVIQHGLVVEGVAREGCGNGDDEDADADGEYEEDAEGEPDTELLAAY
jgi:hypothetical protein